MIDVSIIIINYNTVRLTLNCLESIYKWTSDINFEIVLIDNASTDNSVLLIKEKFPDVILIKSDKNLGFGKANNLGSSNAKGTYLFMLNSDTVLIENSIKYLYNFYKKYENLNIGVLGCKLIDDNYEENNSCGYFPTLNDELNVYWFAFLNKLKFCSNNVYKKINLKGIYTNVEMVSGADMFIAKDNFDLIKGFDPRYFLYYEESDLQYRLSKYGFKNFIFNNTSIIHLEGSSVGRTTNFKRIVVQQSKNLYLKKHFKKHYYKYFIIELCLIPFHILNQKFSFKENFKYIISNLKSL